MPIPLCDKAAGNEFVGELCCLMDAKSVYNQILAAKYSQPNLDFDGPNCSKYTYTVMLFVPVNGPVIFIIFIHNIDST